MDRRERLDGLDGLRGIAALCVFLMHVFSDYRSSGYLAVDFFFMLSGYVLARRYEAGLTAGGLGREGRRFLIARMHRLLPTLFVAGLFALPWLWTQPLGRSPLFVAACLALPWVLNLPAWSVGAELFANLVHAVALARLGTKPLGMLVGMSFVVVAIMTYRTGLDLVPGRAAWSLIALRTLASYCAGILLYRLWRDVPPVKVGPIATWSAMPAFLLLASLAPQARGWADLLFVAVLCPLLIAGGLRNGRGSRLASVAGAFSFPLYAAHAPAILSIKALGLGRSWQFAGGLAAGLLLWAVMDLAARRAGRQLAAA